MQGSDVEFKLGADPKENDWAKAHAHGFPVQIARVMQRFHQVDADLARREHDLTVEHLVAGLARFLAAEAKEGRFYDDRTYTVAHSVHVELGKPRMAIHVSPGKNFDPEFVRRGGPVEAHR